jgi:hypothetical protein
MRTNYDLRNGHTDLALAKPRSELLKKSFKFSVVGLNYGIVSPLIQNWQSRLIHSKNYLKQNYNNTIQ